MGNFGVEASVEYFPSRRIPIKRVIPSYVDMMPRIANSHQIPPVVHGFAGNIHGIYACSPEKPFVGKGIPLAYGNLFPRQRTYRTVI